MNQSEKNTLLIVDDEEMNRRLLTGILRDDYDITAADSGAAAIQSAFESPPDLILLDVLMPEMDGYEVLATLKRDEKTRKIPVIFITGLDSKEDEEKGLSMDAADYISKPFSVGIVKLRVRNQIQIVNQIRTIERLSLIDQLTGIPNRRNLDNHFQMEWSRARRENIPISLMMMDIDKFKLFNDTYGHLIGDEVLKLVAASFGKSLKRKSDFAARYGGEEFSILLPNTETDGAKAIAEQVRKGVEELIIPIEDGKTTRVTISIGLHTFIPTENDTIPDMIDKADQALYIAKESGRNRVCVYAVQDAAGTEGKEPEASGEGSHPDNVASDASDVPSQGEGTKDPAASVLDALREVDGINVALGMRHFQGMDDLYIDSVSFFSQRLPEVSADMDRFVQSGDIKGFSISVHSMKSMLSTVGASDLSQMAAKLETAAKGGDADLVNANYPELHEKLTRLSAKLTPIFSASSNASDGARKKIIHVDDVSYSLMSLRERLSQHFEVLSAQSADALFEILGSTMPDIILLDVNMPGVGGLDIMRRLSADEHYRDIKVIFLSSAKEQEIIDKAMELGAVDYVSKPIPDVELIARLEKHLS